MRCFFNWAVDAGYLDRSPFRGMRNVRLQQRSVQPFSVDQVKTLLDACGDGPVGTRDRALLLTLPDTGARCSEVVQLLLADLELETRRIRILHAKGNKQRVAPFADRCAEALHAYLELRGSEPDPLFLASNRHGRLMSDGALRPNGAILRRLGKKTGIPKVHAHRFRHTFATWVIQHDARELDVQYLLGHASPGMVRRYSSSYRSEQAALRHVHFSPGDQMLTGVSVSYP